MRGLMNLDNLWAPMKFWAPSITIHIFKFTSCGSDADYGIEAIIDLHKWYLNTHTSTINVLQMIFSTELAHVKKQTPVIMKPCWIYTNNNSNNNNHSEASTSLYFKHCKQWYRRLTKSKRHWGLEMVPEMDKAPYVLHLYYSMVHPRLQKLYGVGDARKICYCQSIWIRIFTRLGWHWISHNQSRLKFPQQQTRVKEKRLEQFLSACSLLCPFGTYGCFSICPNQLHSCYYLLHFFLLFLLPLKKHKYLLHMEE